jgi:ubiquinone/menaquinone biosynthesis C-methylase UbiE
VAVTSQQDTDSPAQNLTAQKSSLARRPSWLRKAGDPNAPSDRPSADQQSYWNKIASVYDNFYSDRWSLLEDRLVCHYLGKINTDPAGTILDLACGTGHGYELLRSSLEVSDYHGLDVSQAMLAELTVKHPGLLAIHGTMDDLSGLPSDSYGLATVFYSSASYSADPRNLLLEINRLLEPGGYVYCSVLNRTSLRRIIGFKRRSLEFYRTRGDTTTNPGVPAIALSRREIRAAAKAAGLEVISLHGLGALAGVFQHASAWRLSRLIDVVIPYLGHTQELTARKVK